MSGLIDHLRAFDGRAVTLLSEAQAKFGDTPSFVSDLVDLTASEEGHVSDGGTWLLKSNLEDGVRLTPAQKTRLVTQLGNITQWQAQLHICQMLDDLDVPADAAATVVDWLSSLLEHKRPFLRAWSMNALQSLAAQHGTFAASAEAALTAAERDKAASVRARARNIRRETPR